MLHVCGGMHVRVVHVKVCMCKSVCMCIFRCTRYSRVDEQTYGGHGCRGWRCMCGDGVEML